MMKQFRNLIRTGVLVAFSGLVVGQDEGITAKEALDRIAREFGEESVAWVAEIRGRKGIPQPEEWEVLVFDEREPRLLSWFRANDRGRVQSEGRDGDAYPKNPPSGYVRADDIRMDSRAAFRVAEGEATKARMGFDSLNYVLKVREFSREPIWRVDLQDANNRNVGKVFLSAKTGEVLRTIWTYTGERAREDGRPLIIDSAAPRDNELPSISRNEPAERVQEPEFTTNNRRMSVEEAPVDRIPLPNDEPEAQPRITNKIDPRDMTDRAPEPVAENDDPAKRLLKMQKETGGKVTDTRIPPPPIPPGN